MARKKYPIDAAAGIGGVCGESRLYVDIQDRGSRGPSGESEGESSKLLEYTQNESDIQGVGAGDYQVTPWGPDNLFPNKLRMLFENNFMPGLLDFKTDMYYGGGFKVTDASGNEQAFTDERAWLESWDVDAYLVAQITDYVTCHNTFGQVRRNKGQDKITDLIHVNAQECRLEMPAEGRHTVKNIIVGDFDKSSNGFTRYPVWDWASDIGAGKPSKDVAMYHGRKPTFGFKYYNYPVFIGAINSWLPVANEIPKIHLAALKNMLMASYHVIIPLAPLQKLREVKGWTPKELNEFVDDKIKEIDDLLCGSENAGKTMYTYSATDDRGNSLDWKIEPIDNQMKEISESYLKLFNDSNQAITSAMQVPPSLACIQLGDKMSSGSEVLNSYNFYVQTRTVIARAILTNPINRALRVNFPGTGARISFWDTTLAKQQDNKTGIAHETI